MLGLSSIYFSWQLYFSVDLINHCIKRASHVMPSGINPEPQVNVSLGGETRTRVSINNSTADIALYPYPGYSVVGFLYCP